MLWEVSPVAMICLIAIAAAELRNKLFVQLSPVAPFVMVLFMVATITS